jgi:antitoxin VapB
MRHIAKLFMNGRSQAVRLPAAYRFDCKEVFIRRDHVSGDIVLSRKPESWDDFFKLVDTADIPQDFMADRDNELPPDREMF